MKKGRIIYKEIDADDCILKHIIDKNDVVWFIVERDGKITCEHADLSHLRYCFMHPLMARQTYINWELYKYAMSNGKFEANFCFGNEGNTFPESYL